VKSLASNNITLTKFWQDQNDLNASTFLKNESMVCNVLHESAKVKEQSVMNNLKLAAIATHCN